uniref:Reverse transcriptase domain-containing protein n=1 Tax=Tanacetum cinerariifolium TaxID=118510 RepID=A0A6L2M608_TANCI|nr:reverse transcriptase domain-containing protein [Tanacetum cinerariifolium]
MPFGLKKVGATYQRLVDKAFVSQIGQNIEVYVDDLVVKSHTEAEMQRDFGETFHMLRKINMKLNLKKCIFGAVEGVFLGYMVTPEGIKSSLDKPAAVLQLPSPRTIKEVQSLNGKLASLNRFLFKSAEKSLPLFKTLNKCIKKSVFYWTSEAEQAFKQLKQHLLELPLLVAPKPKEELIVYLSASYGAISAVLMTGRGVVQTPVYFLSRVLQGPQLNYTSMEKLHLSLAFAAKRLWRTTRKIEHHAGITQYHVPATSVVKTQEPWTLFPGGSLYVDGSGAGLILTSSKGTEFTYALRFQFAASNNEAEYKALIAGLRIAVQMGVQNIHVLVEILKENSIQEKEVTTVVEEDGPTWMTPIMEYLKEWTLPSDRKEARKLRIKARQPLQAEYVIREIHEGSCSMHTGPRNDANHAVDGGKQGPKWEGPYEVTEALGDGAYKLRSTDGTVLSRTWNIAYLKSCYL